MMLSSNHHRRPLAPLAVHYLIDEPKSDDATDQKSDDAPEPIAPRARRRTVFVAVTSRHEKYISRARRAAGESK